MIYVVMTNIMHVNVKRKSNVADRGRSGVHDCSFHQSIRRIVFRADLEIRPLEA